MATIKETLEKQQHGLPVSGEYDCICGCSADSPCGDPRCVHEDPVMGFLYETFKRLYALLNSSPHISTLEKYVLWDTWEDMARKCIELRDLI